MVNLAGMRFFAPTKAVGAQNDSGALMGENVEERRKFIEENALDVVNLDI